MCKGAVILVFCVASVYSVTVTPIPSMDTTEKNDSEATTKKPLICGGRNCSSDMTACCSHCTVGGAMGRCRKSEKRCCGYKEPRIIAIIMIVIGMFPGCCYWCCFCTPCFAKTKERLTGMWEICCLYTRATVHIPRRHLCKDACIRGLHQEDEELLFVAVKRKKTFVVRYLIDSGCKVDVWDKQGNWPLHLAIQNGDLCIVKLLVKAGCKVDVWDKQGNRPLHLAIQNGDLCTVKLLVKAGSVIDQLPKDKRSPLQTVVSNSERNGSASAKLKSIIAVFVDNVNALNLCKTLKYGDMDGAELLLVHGADPNIGTIGGETSLQACCYGGNTHVLTIMLHCGIDWTRENWLDKYIVGGQKPHRDVKACVKTILRDTFNIRPMSLQKACVVSIRRALGNQLEQKVQKLNLPTRLRSRLLLQDICSTKIKRLMQHGKSLEVMESIV